MSAKKYMSVNGASKATATGDLQDLADQGVFVSSGWAKHALQGEFVIVLTPVWFKSNLFFRKARLGGAC
jgi:hypothetical protein